MVPCDDGQASHSDQLNVRSKVDMADVVADIDGAESQDDWRDFVCSRYPMPLGARVCTRRCDGVCKISFPGISKVCEVILFTGMSVVLQPWC